jgi:hypothetical protein
MSDVITQNTPGESEGHPAGVPTYYSWYGGTNTTPGNTPPSNFTAVTGWGQIYPEAGAPAYSNPNATVQIANAKTYVHLTTGEWVLVQDQATNQIAGAHYVADFSGDAHIAWHETVLPDGSVTVELPPIEYNDHFWLNNRGTYAAGTVDGVFVQMDMRTNDPNVHLVANVGADWWLDATAGFVSGFSNNPGAGMSNWVDLSTEWQTLSFYSLSTSQLLADPPPPLVGTTTETIPLITSFSPATVATIVYVGENGVAPSVTELNELTAFTTSQYNYGHQIGVLDPAAYGFEALGSALASTATQFQSTYGPTNPAYPNSVAGDAQFVADAYASIFGHSPNSAQAQVFVNEISLLEGIHTASGAYDGSANIDLLARGGIFGLMLGIRAELEPFGFGGIAGVT